jgi:hypothetical protein
VQFQLTHLAAKVEAIAIGQTHIEDDKVWMMIAGKLQTRR